MDPLSSYDYGYNFNQGYNDMYNVKMEPLQAMHVQQPLPYQLPQYQYPVEYPLNKTTTESQPTTNPETVPIEPEDSKEHIKLLEPNGKRKTKRKGKTSNYWNKKVEDKNFPFYGCTICNVSFATIQDLDQHVTIHKGRITSYDIRVRNQIKRKEKLKLQKKLKKLGKLGKNVKLEENKKIDIDIKPEDGYIGNETAAEYNETNQNENINSKEELLTTEQENKTNEHHTETNEHHKETNESEIAKDTTEKASEVNNDKKSLKKSKIQYKVPEDPRLMKLFKCFACEKQFSLSYYLKLHVRSHTDEKPYTCAECGQSFITASKLGRHNKRIHLAVRYQCRICFRTFYRFDILRRHFDKAHKEDKLEGEPYDYNAILPYLKELEEQLKENELKKEEATKTEAQDFWGSTNVIDKVGKSDDVWDNNSATMNENVWGSNVSSNNGINENEMKVDRPDNVWYGDNPYIKEEAEDTKEQLPLENILVEEVKVDAGIVEVKLEVNDDAPDHHNDDDDGEVDLKDEEGDDSNSEDDYFPTNTWATPKEETNMATPQKKVKKSHFPYNCEFCDKVINTPSYYKVHLRTHSGERPFKCYICDKGFITSSKMHRHVLTHEEYWEKEGKSKNQVKCKDGDSKLEDNDENKETKPKKRKSKKSKDPTAKKKRKSCTVLKKEYKKRPHACMYCKKRFLHLETLQVHQKCHEGEDLILKCYYCLETLPNEEELKSHEAQHTGNRPYLCTICGRNYTKRETMIYHRKQHDSGTNEKRNDFICDVCSKIFYTQSKLQRHLVSHRVDKFVLKYECPVCAHMFNTKYHIQMHLSTHQKEGLILEENRNEILAMVLQNARKFPKKGDTSLSLTELVPSEERSTVCNICGEVFQHFYYLEEHLKSHGSKIAVEDENKPEDKKHICPICQKGFKLHYYLKLHSFTHTKLKPFICQQCGKGFITKGKLKRHLETHTGLKKYQCHICYKFFTRPSYLRIHVRTIHGTQDYNFRLDKQCLMVGFKPS